MSTFLHDFKQRPLLFTFSLFALICAAFYACFVWWSLAHEAGIRQRIDKQMRELDAANARRHVLDLAIKESHAILRDDGIWCAVVEEWSLGKRSMIMINVPLRWECRTNVQDFLEFDGSKHPPKTAYFRESTGLSNLIATLHWKGAVFNVAVQSNTFFYSKKYFKEGDHPFKKAWE